MARRDQRESAPGGAVANVKRALGNTSEERAPRARERGTTLRLTSWGRNSLSVAAEREASLANTSGKTADEKALRALVEVLDGTDGAVELVVRVL